MNTASDAPQNFLCDTDPPLRESIVLMERRSRGRIEFCRENIFFCGFFLYASIRGEYRRGWQQQWHSWRQVLHGGFMQSLGTKQLK